MARCGFADENFAGRGVFMGGYTKNIAVIKGLKQGFSSDGGELSGLVKCEKYGAHLTVEVSFINFAPLTEGRFVTAVSDGATAVIVENGAFAGTSDLDCSKGFAALICYINGGVFPVASAICGSFRHVALTLKEVVESRENALPPKAAKRAPAAYDDEAIAEENYYELSKADKDGNAVFEDKKQEKKAEYPPENAEAACTVAEEREGVNGAYIGGNAENNFYNRLKNEIEGILSAYPRESEIEEVMEGSKWVKISYGEGKYYLFGVLSAEGKPRYICYGVPAGKESDPPESMRDCATYIPAGDHGYWVMYQDATTGLTYVKS